MALTQPHVVLLGDSIFDNAAYTHGAPDVLTHLQRLLPAHWRASLCAVDGATCQGLASQLQRIPGDASHLVIAVGGNDALQNSDVLSMRVESSAQALDVLADRVTTFEGAYRSAIREVLTLHRRTAVCTIYNGALAPELARIARVALATFNDVILRTALEFGLDVLELRAICTEPTDYANPIEPSDEGGRKIARAIVRVLGAANDADVETVRIWGRIE